ncbi:uncharacterized protein LOC113570078 [Electrophorus electricus]|uniref:uncharacterized protein LOC113570078 n=1 Tax=Electrophorus electricus TaxID=8005 RepID=UPI0015D05F55|nr:uncharacterized protein LOC113570078 [Electrophorus electricus]
MTMSSPCLLLLRDFCIVFVVSIFIGECHTIHQGHVCKSACSVPWNMQRGQRHTYRYSTSVTTSLKGPSPGSSQLAFDCVVDITVIQGCPDMVLRLRNPQIKQSSLKRDNSMLRQKSIREALEKNPLRFLLQGGKVTGLCPREAEQVWALNIKRAILSMLQTSHSERARETVRETDVYGTCTSSYEQKGPSLVKTRYIQQCLRERVNDFWWQSVPLKEDTTVNASLKCTQLYGTTMMDKVNCTETMTLVPLSGSLDQVQTTTVSTLTLLRTLEGIKVDSGLQDEGYLTDLRFKVETENPARGGARSAQEVSGTVRRLCAHSAEQEQQSELFLSLVLQLRTLTLQQLKDVWQEVSFKCRDDWQPLVEALPACGSETCIHFTTSLILNNEIDQDHSISFLSAITFAPHPTLSMISHIRALLKFPLLRPKTILALSSLVHHICQKEHISCSEIPEVQQFVRILKESLEQGCGGQGAPGITELLHVLKAVGNIGEAVGALIPQLNICIRNHSVPLELRIAAVQAFRRIPCHSERGVLAWAYEHPHEDVEVRISAYQQLMHCPDQEVFKIIRATLRNETSTQVGSFVWSHLFNLQKTEDPLKKDLMESLPHDIISKDFEAEPWKYSSHMDFTMDTGVAVANVEGALVFSHMSLLPRSAMANMTVHILGRSFNLFEVSLRMENAEHFLWSTFEGPDAHDKKSAHNTKSAPRREKRKKRSEERWSDPQGRRDENANCHIPSPPNTKSTGHRERHSDFQCWINVKMFGRDLTFMTCNELIGQMRDVSLSLAGFTVKLLKGQEVKVNYRAIALAEELVLPSLSGVPIKLSINISSSCSLGVKGTANFKDWSQFSLAGYIKPNAFIAISARIGVDGALGRSGLEWVTWVRTSTSMDGGAYVHNGQSLKMVLNMPEDVMDIMSFSSRMYHVSGESREELTVSRTLKEKTTCTPKTWSKMLGCQLCSDVIYPVSLIGRGFPPPGPVLFTLRFQKLDKGLQKYILEAAYAFVPQRNSWLPLETNLLIFFGTPQSTIPRDVSLDFSVSPQRLNLKITHPLKTILIQGQINELNGLCTGRAELRIDDSYYYLKGLKETISLQSEKRTHYELEAKITANGHPVVLSVNVTHGLSRKISVSAKLRNVFIKDASFSVQLGRRQDDGQRQYSMDAVILLPNILSMRTLGMLGHRGPDWSFGLRVRYGVSEDSQNKGECHISQNLRDEVGLDEKHYSMQAEHELVCSHITSINHKIQLRHERSPIHIQSSLDLSYGKHWNQASNKERVLLSQSIRNQSGPSLTSYALEFSLRIPEQRLNYRIQLLHSHQKRRKSESSTHLKVNYNDQIPLVAGLHWKDMSTKASLRKWEGSFNMDTPWLYVHMAPKLTQPQYGTTHFTSEITTRKWITIHNLMMEGLYRERNRDVEWQLHFFTPTVTYLKVGGGGMLGKHSVNASCCISTAWTPALRGEILLGDGKQLKTLDVNTRYGKQTLNISASLNTLDKKLKKKLVVMSMTLSELNSPYLELEIRGRVEEMRKDKYLYQKRWVLHFRQPFRFLPQSLLLQETFTIDLHKGLYILESKTLLHDNRKAIHILTLGSRSHHPHVCSSLIHSFNLEHIPRDSEICISILNNQTVWELQGRIWAAKKERLVVLGQLQLPSEASQQSIVVKFNLTQLLQLNIPSSITLYANMLKNHWKSMESEYSGKGNVAIDDTDYDAYLAVKRSPDGKISNSIYIGSDGKLCAVLDVSLANTIQTGVHAVVFDLSFQQTLLPVLTTDGHINLRANSSSKSFSGMCVLQKREELFRAELSVAVVRDPELQLSLSGDLIISLPGFPLLPHVSSLIGFFNNSKALTKGELTVMVDEAAYGVELTHGHGDAGFGGMNGGEMTWLCALAQGHWLCINISRSSGQDIHNGLQAQVSHSVPWLLSAGFPAVTAAGAHVNRSGSNLFAIAHLHAGAQELKITVQRGGHSTGATNHLLVNCTGGISPGHLSGFCYTEALDQSLRMDIWLNLAESVRVASENSDVSSLSLEIQGHHLSSSVGLMVNINHNISSIQPFVPCVLQAKSQLNHSTSLIKGAAELLTGKSMMCFEGQVSHTKTGFKQTLELYHSLPQLKLVPSTVLVRTVYARQNGSYTLAHHTEWVDSDTTGPAGLQPHKSHVIDESGSQSGAHGWGLEVRLEREALSKRGDVLVDWTLGGEREQMRATGSWRSTDRGVEAVLELEQPFTPMLSHLHLHTQSHSPLYGSSNQVQLCWDHGTPVNVSLTLRKHWYGDSSSGQACIFMSPGQMRSVLPLVDAQGCILVAQEGKASYSQRAELKWSDKSITQSMKYERGAKGMHTVQVEAGVQNVSPRPCPSHTLRAKMHTNLRDIIEHHILLGLCPPQPALSWSGSHRVNSGKVMLHSQTVLSVVGQAPLSAFTLALRNSSSSQRGNYSLLAQWKVGNWSAELSTSVHSSERTTGLQLQAGLDHGELLWLQARRGKRCLQAAAGYVGDSSDDLRTALCLEERHWLTLEVQRGGRSIENEALALISMGIANRSLIFQAKGCEECLLATEARLQQLRTHIRRKLLERVQKVHHLLLDVKRQAGGSGALQELCDGPLRLARRAEHLLLRPAPLPWEHRPLGHVLSHGLPKFLQWLHDMSQLVQQELRKPLTTLAGAYHDVTGERLDTLWHQGLQIWSRELAQLLPEVLHYQHLRAPALTALQTTIAALDLVGQQTVHWAEARFAAMLVGVRRQLALMYKFSRRDEEVRVKIPLPRNPWPKGSGANVVEVLLEEFLLKPLLALNSASLTADLYRLKRRLMDSPFNHQAFLVADEFAVSFDGHLFAVPAFCNLILASDVTKNTFSIMLQSNGPKQRSLVVQLKNTTVKIHPNAQVEANCHGVHTPFTNHDVTIMREMNLLIVSNRKGLLVSCDPYVRVCRITLEGWLHGLSSGLLGTNDNEAGNERPLPDGSQAPSMTEFMLAWQLGSPQTGSSCIRARGGACQTRSMEEPSCALLFSSTSSPLSACFRVVDPEQFLAVCESSVCGSVDVSSSAPCRLSSAYIQLCLRNYVPLEMPIQCV